jgi:hypothetical protein
MNGVWVSTAAIKNPKPMRDAMEKELVDIMNLSSALLLFDAVETSLDLFSDFPQEKMAMGTEFLEVSSPVGNGALSTGVEAYGV